MMRDVWGVITIWLLLAVIAIGPLVQHVVWCINQADQTGSAIALLIVGLIIAPVGWLHGVSVLFGLGGWI